MKPDGWAISLARDRMGEKPLCYNQTQDGSFLFASEVRALLFSGLVERKLEPLTLRVLLYNGFTVAPHTTLKGIYSLLPAHWMRVGLDGAVSIFHEALTDKDALDRLGLQAQGVGRILKDRSLPWSRLWALYVLVRWTEKYRVAL